MVKFTHKKLNLSVMVVVFLTTLLLIPAANGAGGSSVGTAPTLAPGYYPNESRDSSVYYNVSGNIGSNLTVIITYGVGEASTLFLYAPNGTQIDLSMTVSGIEVVTTICDSNELYTIRVSPSNGIGVDSFALTICLDDNCGGDGIPGFDLLVAFLGIVTLVGLIIFYKKRQILSI